MGDNEVKKLWGREFNIVEKGLDEAQVVGFVSELLSQHKVALQQQKNLAHLRMLADTTIVEANKLAASIMEQAKREAEAEAARIVAQAEQRAREIVEQAENAATIEEEPKQEQIATLETGTELDRAQDEVIKALGQSQEGTATKIQKDEQATAAPDKQIEATEKPLSHYTPVQETPSEAKPDFAPGEKESPTLYEGQIELVIAPPADFARLRELERHLHEFPQVKTLLTGGSWARGNTLIVFLEEPIPLVDALRNMPDVAEVKVLSQSKHSPRKTILIIPKNEQAQLETGGLAATQHQNEESRQKPRAGSLSQPPPNEQPLLHPEQVELIVNTLDSGDVLKLWTILSALPEVNIVSMNNLKDASGAVFKLDVAAGFPLVEHLKAMISSIVLVKDSNRIQAQLP